MVSTRASAAGVLERFPNDWEVIVGLCGQNEGFRELCEHYAECQTVLSKLRTSSDTTRDRVQEYEDLIEELEQEIRRTLAAAT